jgi:hypothetical protein
VSRQLACCGTDAGYQRHLRHGEQPCEPCKAATTAKQREFRRNNPDAYQREKDRNAARGRALERLADEYPERFGVLLDEERLPLYLPDVAS